MTSGFSAYPFGAVYLLEPEYSWSEVIRDMDLMEAHGFNYLTLWPAANSWLAKSPDEFVFTDTLRFLDLAHAKGMKVLVQLIGQNQSQEYAPDCLLRPDMILEPGNCFWANPSHPEVELLVRRYLKACIDALGNHPAVFGWDLFNEAHFRSDDAYTIDAYRRWLKTRYGTIDALNRKWLRRYGDFSQINPADRNAPYSVWSSILPSVEYEAFRAAEVTAICQRWSDYVRTLDAVHPIVIDGTSGQLLRPTVINRNSDEFATAYTCDIFGGTYYPKSWGRDLSARPWDLMQYYGVTRAAAVKAGRPYHVNELQTHTQSLLTPGSELPPEELALYIWTALAVGAEAMQLWRWRPFLRGYQCTGRGVTRLDGTPGPRAVAVGELVRTLRAHEAVLGAARPAPADVKIAVGYRSRLFYDAFLKWIPSHQPESVSGWHRIFASLGLAVEATSVEHFDDDDRRTPVIVLPATIALDDGQIEWLERYVQDGGCLIAESRLSCVDTWGVARTEGAPGHTLSRVFGLIERDVGSAGVYEWQGQKQTAPYMTQELEVFAGATVLAKDPTGRPMVVTHHYGRGRTLYFASVQGLQWQEAVPPKVQAFFADWIGGPRLVEKPEQTIVRWHEGEAGTLAYVLNFSANDEAVRFSRQQGPGADVLFGGGVLTESDGAVNLRVPARTICVVRWAKQG